MQNPLYFIELSRVMGALTRPRSQSFAIVSGTKSYISLIERLRNTDVSAKDKNAEDFRKKYSGFFGMQKVKEFHPSYFRFMQQHKTNGKRMTLETILHELCLKTERLEGSFCSKLLSVINPDMPPFDSHVLRNLCLPNPLYSTKAPYSDYDLRKAQIERVCFVYNLICKWYKDFVKSNTGKEWIALFDNFPEIKPIIKEANAKKVKITDVKKIDLILLQIR